MSEEKSTGRESFYAHNLTYPELLAAKDAVINIQGEIIGGPARKYMSEWDRWTQWQKAVVAGSRVLGTIPQPVMDYFQATKGLKKPPVSAGRDIEDAEIVDMRHTPASMILTPPFTPPRFTWSYTSMQEFLTCPAQWAAKRFYKKIKDVESEAMRVGNMIHETAENYGKSLIGVSYKPNLIHAQYLPVVQKYVDVLVKSGAELQFEKEMCFDRQMKLSHWKAWDTVWVRSKADVLAKKGQRLSIIDWKGLALDTPLPTPTGWTTIGDVQEGAKVFGADGKTCTVVGKSKIKNLPCYELTFCDGSTITSDCEHLWEVRERVGKGTYKSSIVSAHDLCVMTGFKKLNVRLSAPIQTAKKPSGLPFYTIGCWLGDGKHTDGSITKGDLSIFDCIIEEGLFVKTPQKCAEGKCATRTVTGLRTILGKEGLLGNKHIPARWLRGAYQDRLSLLQGLMDTDGSWNFTRRQAVFCTVNKPFADEVFELLVTLGQRPTVHTIDGFGFGKAIRSYDITFTPIGIIPFRANIKKEKFEKFPSKNPRAYRQIKVVKLVQSVPTQCIKVDSFDNMYLCGKAMIPTHNTGKYKEDFLQLKMFAVFTALTPGFEDVQEFDPKFIFTKESPPKNILRLEKPIMRSELKGILKEILGVVARMEAAWKEENFPCKKNGLCKNWCLNTECPHCGG